MVAGSPGAGKIRAARPIARLAGSDSRLAAPLDGLSRAALRLIVGSLAPRSRPRINREPQADRPDRGASHVASSRGLPVSDPRGRPRRAGGGRPGARADEDPRTVVAFLQELKAHGLHDIALDYIDQLRADASLPADLKVGARLRGRPDPDRRGRPVERPGAARGAAEGRPGQARGVRQGPSRAAARPATPWCRWPSCWSSAATWRCSWARRPRTRRRRTPSSPRPAPPTSRPMRPTARPSWRWPRPRTSTPISMPEKDPRRPSATPSTPRYLDGMLQKGVCDYELAQTYPADVRRSDEVPGRGAQAVRGALQGAPRAVGRAGRADVAGQVLRGEGRDRARDRAVQAAPGAHRPSPARRSSATSATSTSSPWRSARSTRWRPTRPTQLARGPSTVARSGGRKEGLGVLLELAKAIDAQMPEISEADRPKAVQQIIDALEPGRALRLAVQERGAGAAQEIQAQRRDEGRGDRPPHLPGRHGAGRRGDRLPRVGPRDRPAQGGRAQGRPRPRDRQGQHGPVQPGLLLLHEQAVLRGRRAGRAPGPALSAGRPLAQGDADRACRRWPTRTTPTPRSTG